MFKMIYYVCVSIQVPHESADPGIAPMSRLQEALSKIRKPTLPATQAPPPTTPLSVEPLSRSSLDGGQSLVSRGWVGPAKGDGLVGGTAAVPNSLQTASDSSQQPASGNNSSESSNGHGQRYYSVMW